ncbi:hypothetical protein KAU11_12740 [Candidatus Babeliales bacterium]|nr:hypothetical protein [Candidatus Babeliales bacterium]
MSIQFNDTDSLKGLVQMYEREIGVTRGTVSGNTNLLKEFTADANLAVDDYTSIMIQVSGTWKGDDTNHTDYPEIVTDINSGQRDYAFLSDENGNDILDIYRVYVKETGGAYRILEPIDTDTEPSASTITNGLGASGNPSSYDKVANVIRFDLLPSASVTEGLKVSINREASYFTSTDTTKKAGFPGLHHKYFYLRPAFDYARRNTLTSYPRLEGEVMKAEHEIKEYFDRRVKDESPALNYINRESTR